MSTRNAVIRGALIGLVVLMLAAGALVARTAISAAQATPTVDHMGMMGADTGASASSADGTPTINGRHEMMHRMMDAMRGEGASDRMHEAMGPDGERLMEQCAAMMDMMSMMGGGMGTMDGQDMDGMPGMEETASATPAP